MKEACRSPAGTMPVVVLLITRIGASFHNPGAVRPHLLGNSDIASVGICTVRSDKRRAACPETNRTPVVCETGLEA